MYNTELKKGASLWKKRLALKKTNVLRATVSKAIIIGEKN